MRASLAAIAIGLLGAFWVNGQTAVVAPLKRLENNIQLVTRSLNADWGIYVKCLETGEEIDINADR